MKIAIDIRADEYFTNKVKGLIIQKVNEILKDKQSIQSFIRELLTKQANRFTNREFEKIVINRIENHAFHKYSFQGQTIDDFIKKVIREGIRDMISQRFDTIIRELVKDKYLEK